MSKTKSQPSKEAGKRRLAPRRQVDIWLTARNVIESTNSLSWSPAGPTLALGGTDGVIRLWDETTRRTSRVLEGHPSSITSIAWSPNGQFLVSTATDKSIRLWDCETSSLVSSFDGLQHNAYSVTFSADGKAIASAGYDRTIRVWDARKGQILYELKGQKDWIYSLAWSHEDILASGAANGSIILWDTRRREPVRTMELTRSPIYSLAWSRSKPLLLFGEGNGVTRVFDTAGGKLTHTFRQQGMIRSVAWAERDGSLIAAGSSDGTIKVWDIETNQLVRTIRTARRDLRSIAWAHDRPMLAFGGDNGMLGIWNAKNDHLFSGVKTPDELSIMTFAPNGQLLAAQVGARTIQIRNAETDELLQSLTSAVPLKCLAWSDNGQQLASGSANGLVQLWDVSSGRLVSKFKTFGERVTKLAWSPDRITLAAVTEQRLVFTINLETGIVEKILVRKTSSETLDVSFSPDGSNLLIADADSDVSVWSARTGKVESITSYGVTQMLPPIMGYGVSTSLFFDSTASTPRGTASYLDHNRLFDPYHDLPDMARLLRKVKRPEAQLADSLISKPEERSSWFRGRKKAEKDSYFPKRRSNIVREPFLTGDVISTVWPKRNFYSPEDLFLTNNPISTLAYRLRRFSRYAYYSSYDTYLASYDGYLSTYVWDLVSRRQDQTFDLGDGPPIIDVERYYLLLSKLPSPQSRGETKQIRIRNCAWSPKGDMFATATKRGIVKIWDVKTMRLAQDLEGHSGPIIDLAWSPEGRFLASYSTDRTIRLWRSNAWVTTTVIKTPRLNDVALGISFHQGQTVPFSLLEGASIVYNWKFTSSQLLEAGRAAGRSVHYTSAKIVLVGESNVGKSSLALRLTEDRYIDQSTTHGLKTWVMSPEKLDPTFRPSPHEKRDIILWDMGGQDEYRLVHQLFLHDTSLALILLDPTRGRTAFSEVEGWNLRFQKQIAGRNATKLLVGTKMDQKSTLIDKGKLKRLLSELAFKGFYPTSAKNNKGIANLRKAISASINWDALVRTSRPALFQAVRDEIERQQSNGEVVLLYSDLQAQIKKLLPDEFDANSIDLVAEQLALQGIVAGTRLASGERVLVLQISEIERYAGSLIIAARNNPRGVPALEEQTIASHPQSLPGIKEKERLHKFQERIVLECVVQLLLEHGICLKHEGLLIFPSLFEPTENPASAETHHSISLYYDFSGAIDNIYSSLIVRLAISERFGRVRLWENSAEFDRAGRGICGLRKVDHRSGLAHLDLFFSENTPIDVRDLFTVFIEEHLRREGVDINEVIEVTCRCGYRFEERSLRKRLANGQGDIVCPECESRNIISEGAQKVRSGNSEIDEKLFALKTIIYEKSRDAIISTKVTFMTSPDERDLQEPTLVLHLSDLHIKASDDPMTLLQPLVRDLEDPRAGLGIDRLNYLVISGDLTNSATPEEFEQAYQFISRIIERFRLTAERCIIVPGNHDLSWDKPVYEWKQERVIDIQKLADGSYSKQGDVVLIRNDKIYPSRFENFANFYHSLKQQEYPLRVEEQSAPLLFEDSVIQFMPLNSAWETDLFFPDRASINDQALSRGLAKLDEQVRKARSDGRLTKKSLPLRVAVLHHPPTGNEQIAADAFLQRLRQEDFHLCLHGHVHEERVGTVGAPDPIRNVHIVGAGSFGAPAYARPESVPRLYNVIEIAPDLTRIRVHTRSMSKKGGAWTGWAVWPADSPTERRTYYDIGIPQLPYLGATRKTLRRKI